MSIESELCQYFVFFFILGGEELGWPSSGKGGMVTERLRNTALVAAYQLL